MEFELSAFIQRPVGEVFGFLRDIERYAGLPGSVVPVYDKLTPGPTGVGTRYREVIRLTPWHSMENESELTEFEPPARLASRFWFRNGRLHGALLYTLTPHNGGTHLTQRQTLAPRGWLRPLRPLIRFTFARQLRRRLDTIKFLLDHSAVAAPGAAPLTTTYYLDHRRQILAGFERRMAPHLRPLLTQTYGAETAEAILQAARQRVAALLPHIPYIGGRRNILTRNLIGATYGLAFYQAMRARGAELDAITRLHMAMTERYFDSVPALTRRVGRAVWSRLFFGRIGRWLMRRLLEFGARRSRRRRYADDFVFDFVPGDGQTFDFGLDYHACAICNFFAAQGAAEFTPTICLHDYPHSALTGAGLVRTMTLAEGAPKCDFRFKRGRAPQNRQVTHAGRW